MSATSKQNSKSPANKSAGIAVKKIAELVGGQLRGNPDLIVTGANCLEHAGPDQLAFADNKKSLNRLAQTKAGCVLVPLKTEADSAAALIMVANPRLAYAKASARLIHPLFPPEGLDPRAVIGNGFKHGNNVAVSPGVVIGTDVVIGDRVRLYPNVVLGNGVEIGSDTVVYPNVTIMDGCRIGKRVIIHAGTVIGSDGYGFVPDEGKYHKIVQLGIVQIDDDVEIGANNTIDRATFGKTWIREGVKTDNLVHVAHNVTVGRDTLLVAQVGIAGSATIGSNVILAGQVGVSGHITIGNKAIVGPQSGVGRSIEPGGIMTGSPAFEHRKWLRAQQVVPRLPEMAKKIRQLEKRLAELEKLLDGKNE